MTALNNINSYNEGLFESLTKRLKHFQIGFFNSNEVLFIGQNPGGVYNEKTETDTARVQAIATFAEHQSAYQTLIEESNIGKYLAPVIRKQCYTKRLSLCSCLR